MILIAISVLTFAAAEMIFLRRRIAERAIRWKLYELRDQLRFAVIEEPALGRQTAFLTLDRSITNLCASLPTMSLWTFLSIGREKSLWNEAKERTRQLQQQLDKPENARLRTIYTEVSEQIAKHLALRHLFLTTVVATTVLGILFAYRSLTRLGRDLTANAGRPDSPLYAEVSRAA